jgi:exodeoxyribonuclease VII large subunit
MSEFKPGVRVFKVSELTEKLNLSLSDDFSDFWVEGEISNFNRHKSGHCFLVLKDEKARLPAIIFRFQALALKFEPEDGLKVMARGRLDFYEPRGELRMIIEYLEPLGIGALQLAFEQMRGRLEKEGLFAPERKKPVPAFCRRIAVITSPTGAVFQDMLKVFRQQDTQVEILLVPSRVQGTGAETELAEALDLVNRPEVVSPEDRPELDAVILARGGGSLEDLWAFNTEVLARAIARSRVPVISAVGHEVDWTIADLVADLRAPTPTAAAEMIARQQKELRDRLQAAARDLERAMRGELELKFETIARFWKLEARIFMELAGLGKDLALKKLRLKSSADNLLREGKDQCLELAQKLLTLSPQNWLRQNQQRLFHLGKNLEQAMTSRLQKKREQLLDAAARLQVLSPLSTLDRGYAIARRKDTGKVVRSAGEVELSALLRLILAKGELGVRVEEKLENKFGEEFPGAKRDEK